MAVNVISSAFTVGSFKTLLTNSPPCSVPIHENSALIFEWGGALCLPNVIASKDKRGELRVILLDKLTNGLIIHQFLTLQIRRLRAASIKVSDSKYTEGID